MAMTRQAKQRRAPTATTRLFQVNLRRVMAADRAMPSQNRAAAGSGVAQTSIGRILRGEQSPTLDVVHRLAEAYGLEAWQMLVPEMEPDNPPITKQIDERQQELLKRFRVAAQELARYGIDRERAAPAPAQAGDQAEESR